ncbi:MAG: response regulator transcription factor [Comamonadaceae bacterium]|jgi:DNA-binding NarL/FixJ family response regulator|nr:response regulator transcription factor [Comamonadaceae bacterium]
MSIRLLLIDDHTLFRSGLRLILKEGLPQVEVLEAASLEQAVQLTTDPPNLVLLDIQLQGVNGLEGIGLLHRRWPDTAVVILSSIATPDKVQLAASRGAAGFVSKGDSSDRIIAVVREVLNGSTPRADVTPAFTTTVPAPPRLTPRQCEVLGLLCEGLSNKVIAKRLQLSEFTVRAHVHSVLGLLEVTSRSQAVFVARQKGLIG